MTASLWIRMFSVVGILFLAYLVAMWVAMVVWTHRDIASRTPDRTQRMGAVILVATFNLAGLLLYFALRPAESSAEQLARQLEMEALAQDLNEHQRCVGCARDLNADFAVCPYCRTPALAQCAACARNLRSAWVLCPYCGEERADGSMPGRERAAGDRGRTRAWPIRSSLERRGLLPVPRA